MTTDCICVTTGNGSEGCGLCNETGSRMTPLYASPVPAQDDDKLREVVASAFEAGAMSVHEYWTANPGDAPRGDPEFGEAAYDHAAEALATLKSTAAQEGGSK